MHTRLRLRNAGLIAFGLLITLLIGTQKANSAPLQQSTFHIVESGETWDSIALTYGVSVDRLQLTNGVINPILLRADQRILIPQQDRQPYPSVLYYAADSTKPAWRIAVLSGNPISVVVLANHVSHPSEIGGQIVAAPDRRDTVSVAEAVPPSAEQPPQGEEDDDDVDEPTPAPPVRIEGELPLQVNIDGSEPIRESIIGVQGHFFLEEEAMEDTFDLLSDDLKASWVKYQVDWSIAEYADNEYATIDELDAFIDDAFDHDVRVLLSIVKAPDWARNSTEEDGPPIDYNQYYDFVGFLVGRYSYKLHAIEVWNEPNLKREWNGSTLSGGAYVELLAGTYDRVKSINPAVTVVSAGLAPTGINDGVNAVDDRVYLRQMYEAGLANHADAIGIHPYGWANPPQARCCDNPSNLPGFTDSPHFYFLDTIEDYREIQAEFGDLERQLWATEFGWGTVDGLEFEVPAEQPFFAYLNQGQQAQYIVDAYRIGQSWEFMGPMFLWNLNVSALYGYDPNQAGYSIITSLDNPREAFRRLRDTPKVDDRDD